MLFRLVLIETLHLPKLHFRVAVIFIIVIAIKQGAFIVNFREKTLK